MTRKGTAPIKLWFDSAEEMQLLSNKRNALAELYKILDYNGLGRIDTMELFAVILLSIEGKFEVLINSNLSISYYLFSYLDIMLIFGFSEEGKFYRDEFHFFLDCLFRGIMKLVIPTREKKPVY
jgi:hypothetical protein